MEVIHTSGTLTLDPNQLFNMNGIAESLYKIRPSDPSLHVIGVDFTLVGLQCKTSGIIDPVNELKEAASRIYHYAMQAVVQPIWTALYSLYNALKRFGLAVIDLKIPIPHLNLHISDLFNPDLYSVIEKFVKDLYLKGKDKIISILNALSIPYPLFKTINAIEEEIRYIVKHIWSSLWDQLMKKITLIKDLIQTGLRLYDLIIYKKIIWSEIWKVAVEQALQTILHYLSSPPSIDDIKQAVVAFAKKALNKAEVTYEEIMKTIHNFKLPIFGSPFDWLFPLNPHVNIPEIDFNKILGDIKLWLNNFVINIMLKFMKIIKRILSLFGIVFQLPKISIPISVCAIRTPTYA